MQYSPLSSAPALLMIVQEQEDYRREYLEFRVHGVLLPRGVCRGERFPTEMAVSAVFLSTVNPPRKRWRIEKHIECLAVLNISQGAIGHKNASLKYKFFHVAQQIAKLF
ncbi:hypothetical protein NDU88_005175 [Pleurodeles waltl]|uniref:Uncharacterized protein n=1 Tax=Pleurodeles waltl TaxID=8319 RepID=A0AAV7NQP8_PLEWA|nr:hypothetical protein NDU88_005175 [Pleurodeles waltl]